MPQNECEVTSMLETKCVGDKFAMLVTDSRCSLFALIKLYICVVSNSCSEFDRFCIRPSFTIGIQFESEHSGKRTIRLASFRLVSSGSLSKLP